MTTRKIGIAIAVILVIGFFISLFLVLALYLQGRKITPEGTFVEAGIIRLNDIPNDADVLLNGDEVNVQSSQLRGLEFNDYKVEVQKEGFIPWVKEVSVEDTFVYNLYPKLYPENLPETELLKEFESAEYFYRDIEEEALYVVTLDEEDAGIWKISESNSFFRNIIQYEQIIEFEEELVNQLEDASLTVEVAPTDEKALLEINNNSDETLIIIEDRNNPINLGEKLGYIPEEITWFDADNTLLINEGNLLYEYDYEKQVSQVVFYNPNTKYKYAKSLDNILYFWNSSTKTLDRFDGNSSVPVAEDMIFIEEDVTNVYASKVAASNSVIIQTDLGIYYVDFLSEYIEFLPAIASVESITPDARTMLVERAGEKVILSFRKTVRELDDFSNFEVIEIEELSSLTYLRDDLSLVEIDGSTYIADEDTKNRFELANLEEQEQILETSILLSSSNEYLYYAESRDNGFSIILQPFI